MKKLLFLIILNSTFYILNSFCFSQQNKLDSLLTLLKKDKEDTSKVNHLNALSRLFMYQNPDTAITLANQALGIITPVSSPEFSSTKDGAVENKVNAIRANTLGNLGSYYYLKTDYINALDFYLKALKIDETLNNNKGIAKHLGNIGNVYVGQGNYTKALDNYLKALKIDDGLDNKNGIATHLCNIGSIYCKQGDYPKALDYYFKAQKMFEVIGFKNDIASILGNIGSVYGYQGNYTKALDYYFKTLKITQELGNKTSTAAFLGNIGAIYSTQGDYPKAIDYYFQALEIDNELGFKEGMAVHLCNIGSLYTVTGKFKEAEQYLNKAIDIDNSIGTLDYLRQTEELLSILYDTTGRTKEAFFHYKKAIALKDTLFSQESKKQLIRKEMNYEFDKKEAATKAENEKQQAVATAEKHKQQFVLILVSFVLVLVFIFAAFVFRSLRITRKQKNIIEVQKNEVLQQKEMVEKQKEIVEKQKEEIVESITYAQCIQQRILLEESAMRHYLPNSFIYYQPKDIVSSNFYWFTKIDDIIILAAIDCTGHGVPGAFMSIIGNTLLNEIVNKNHKTLPSEILRLLNLGVYDALHQKKDEDFLVDGMVIALCSIDYKNNILQFAGAQNPLYVVSDNTMEVIQADIHEIGGDGRITKIIAPIKKGYTNNVIPIKKDMSIYLFSDGYVEQFGGDGGEKYGTPKFKELLLSNHHLTMQKQKEVIVSAHADWKGLTDQVDDILVMGVKL